MILHGVNEIMSLSTMLGRAPYRTALSKLLAAITVKELGIKLMVLWIQISQSTVHLHNTFLFCDSQTFP